MRLLLSVPVCLLLPLLYIPTKGRISFENSVVKVNSAYGTGNITITKTPTGSSLSVYSDLIVALNGKITVKMDVFTLAHKRRRLLMPLPKLNYCDLFRGLVSFGPIKTLVSEMNRYGNLTRECPISGYSSIVGFQIDDAKYGAFVHTFPNGKYLVDCDVVDENGPKPINIIGIDVYLTKS